MIFFRVLNFVEPNPIILFRISFSLKRKLCLTWHNPLSYFILSKLSCLIMFLGPNGHFRGTQSFSSSIKRTRRTKKERENIFWELGKDRSVDKWLRVGQALKGWWGLKGFGEVGKAGCPEKGSLLFHSLTRPKKGDDNSATPRLIGLNSFTQSTTYPRWALKI
jgi:hypothetical protein